MKTSELERTLETHIKQVGLPEPRREFAFALPERRWRADFAWPEKRLIVEVEGGTWSRGAHTRGGHFESDCEKYNWASLHDWIVLRFTTDMVKDGRAIKTIEWAFKSLAVQTTRQLKTEIARLKMEIDKVPDLLVYGNWDYKRCLFCGGKRGHEPGCIKSRGAPD